MTEAFPGLHSVESNDEDGSDDDTLQDNPRMSRHQSSIGMIMAQSTSSQSAGLALFGPPVAESQTEKQPVGGRRHSSGHSSGRAPKAERRQSTVQQQIAFATKRRQSTMHRQANVRELIKMRKQTDIVEGEDSLRNLLVADLVAVGNKWAEEHETRLRKAFAKGFDQTGQEAEALRPSEVPHVEEELERHRRQHTRKMSSGNDSATPACANGFDDLAHSQGCRSWANSYSLQPPTPHGSERELTPSNGAPRYLPSIADHSPADSRRPSKASDAPIPLHFPESVTPPRTGDGHSEASYHISNSKEGETSEPHESEFTDVVPETPIQPSPSDRSALPVQVVKSCLKTVSEGKRSVVVLDGKNAGVDSITDDSWFGQRILVRGYTGELGSNPYDGAAFESDNFPMWSMWNPVGALTRNSNKRRSSHRGTMLRQSWRDIQQFSPFGHKTSITSLKASKQAVPGNLLLSTNYNIRPGTCVMTPNSPFRVFWDLCSVIFVMSDCILLPLQFLDLPDYLGLTIAAWCSKIFWAIDFLFCFFTGYFMPDGMIECRFKKTVLNYIETWCLFDFSMLATDWLTVVSSSGNSDLVVMRPLRLLKFFRMLRLLRLLRLGKYEAMAQQYLSGFINTEALSVLFRIVKIVVTFVWINHLIACSWYGIGKSTNGTNWLEINRMYSKELFHRYTVSYHWSLCLFSGFIEIGPVNQVESSFNVVISVFAFFATAWIVSTLTSELTNLEIVSASATKQLNSLRKYLGANNISQGTCLQIHRNVKNAMRYESLHPPEDRVQLLRLVSEPLMIVLHFEMYIRLLSAHPFMREYAYWSTGMMKKVTHTALRHLLVSKGEVVFCIAEVQSKPCMYFVKSGHLEYTREAKHAFHELPDLGVLVGGSSQGMSSNNSLSSSSTSFREKYNGYRKRGGGAAPGRTSHDSCDTQMTIGASKEIVEKNSWFCEPALWTPWEHFGTMTAKQDCEILIFDALEFVNIAKESEKHGIPAYKYGYKFLEHLNAMDENEISDLHIESMQLEKIAQEVFGEEEKPGGSSIYEADDEGE